MHTAAYLDIVTVSGWYKFLHSKIRLWTAPTFKHFSQICLRKEKILFYASEKQSHKPNQKNSLVYAPGTKMYNYSHCLLVARHDTEYLISPISILTKDTN